MHGFIQGIDKCSKRKGYSMLEFKLSQTSLSKFTRKVNEVVCNWHPTDPVTLFVQKKQLHPKVLISNKSENIFQKLESTSNCISMVMGRGRCFDPSLSKSQNQPLFSQLCQPSNTKVIHIMFSLSHNQSTAARYLVLTAPMRKENLNDPRPKHFNGAHVSTNSF